MLRESQHQLVMITGDNTLTAAAVARDLGLITKPIAILRDDEWQSLGGKTIAPFDAFADKKMAAYELGMAGDELAKVFDRESSVVQALLPRVSVFVSLLCIV